ncbi:bacillithiol biosynthesis cysteine-adding enzyme BshC [Paenalkalicoccus suaedae]|uniref:Putative cysteine ligase BshC n=1 Tax=Paenalkalicoccus suaedae TaxID=2592382 RepID=A0A859FFS9_9BACI|nr:bacillithiol biosynthesis cysteine-adding enzyme BshC [Paenalkalicoccus suaedae]QKS71532.1 bacillithiol biosynthesis cysteine-adding enzyme BshC [Paenalkalicoccus suaedae]
MQVLTNTTYEKPSFLHSYIKHDAQVHRYFDYSLDDTRARYDEITKYTYQRTELTSALRAFQENYHPDPSAYAQIERLKDPTSVVVVGGQQAGFLTGPLYTVNKIISILHEAKRVERALSKPVIPLFWIAGEDHDVDEVNHTYVHDKEAVKRIRLPERNDVKTPASERYIDPKAAKEQVLTLFKHLPETMYTESLLEELLNDLTKEVTYTTWCAMILHRLFEGTGLVLMDAADPSIREIERPIFADMVSQNERIRANFLETARTFQQEGYGEPITIEEENAHLFYHDGDQRFLLSATETGFVEKNGSRTWTKEELSDAVQAGNIQLSNNVVTRPVMQDMLLPVHTFIAGPGELKYWSVLKDIFHLFGHHMPIIRPRLQVTLLSRSVSKWLDHYELDLVRVSQQGTEELRNQVINESKVVDHEALFEHVSHVVNNELNDMLQKLAHIEQIEGIHETAKSKLMKTLGHYEARVTKKVEQKQAVKLSRLLMIEAEMKPEESLQERQLNVYSFLNAHGGDLVKRISHIVEELDVDAATHIYLKL